MWAATALPWFRPEGQNTEKFIIITKAMMRRVRGDIRHREPGQLETGTEGPAEHGLGAAWPNEPSL